MRFVVEVTVLTALTLGASAQVTSVSYQLLLNSEGHTWCGYTDTAAFTSDIKKLDPTESARVTYSAGKLIEVTYQFAPESGDWVVVDKYTPSNDGLILRRANLLTQDNLQVIEETSIRRGKLEPFRVVSTTTLDGKKAEASPIDLPRVSVKTNFSEMPFWSVVAEMRRRAIPKLCKQF
jgi:hypothetical protein